MNAIPSYFACMLLLFTGTVVQAQAPDVDVIYLKNGERLVGSMVRYAQGKKAEIRLTDSLTIEVNDVDILHIVQGVGVDDLDKLSQQQNTNEAKILAPRTKGFYNTTDIFFGFGSGNDNSDFSIAAGLHNTTGWQWSPLLGTGLGFGVDNYSRRGETVFPVYLELRSLLPARKKDPKGYFISLAGGYGFAFKREKSGIVEAKGGWMAYPAAGYRMTSSEGNDISFDLGVKFQKALFIHETSGGELEEREILFRRLCIRIGLTFWK